MDRTSLHPWHWSTRWFDQAVHVVEPTRWLVCSGQTSIDADGRPRHAGDMAAQVEAAVANLDTVLRAGDMTLGDVVRVTAYVTDMDAFLAQPRRWPGAAFTLIGVTRLAYPELMVELEAIAAR
ncbi:MAG TPA: RidA family protein [Acidimicrobiales bacterium]|nr:RidA family protein [Acidimicrobiales bacterium]